MAEHIKIICQNRKAHHDYQIQETVEAGLVLTGPEVKSLRLGRANLKDSYAKPKGGEVFLHEVHISPYENSPLNEQDPTRTRKLLLHKQEIRRLTAKIKEKGLTLVPLRLYFLGGKAKSGNYPIAHFGKVAVIIFGLNQQRGKRLDWHDSKAIPA